MEDREDHRECSCASHLLLRSMNAPVMVELNGESDPLEIAMKELREKKIPFAVRRYLPDGRWAQRIDPLLNPRQQPWKRLGQMCLMY